MTLRNMEELFFTGHIGLFCLKIAQETFSMNSALRKFQIDSKSLNKVKKHWKMYALVCTLKRHNLLTKI